MSSINDGLFLAGMIAILFFIVKIGSRYIIKDSEIVEHNGIKYVVKDTVVVFLCAICSIYGFTHYSGLMNKTPSEIIGGSSASDPIVFTDNPQF